MFEQKWTYVVLFLLFLVVSSLLKWIKNMKGKQVGSFQVIKVVTTIVVISLLITAFVSLPLLDQPRLAGKVILPAGFFLVVLGLFINILVAKELQHVRFEMKGLGSPERLITTGLFGVIRHPSSMVILFIMIGWYLVWRALYCIYWAVPVIVIGILIENHFEERNLEKIFGNDYREYKKRVGKYFPRIARLRWDKC